MADQTIVSLPSRAWADCAVMDLAAAGCCARVLDELDCEGRWQVQVSGSREQIAELCALLASEPAPAFRWEAFVNSLGGPAD